MPKILASDEFGVWLSNMKDARGKARILARIRSAELGNFGDSVTVGEGISEMRIHFGLGYRIYYARRGTAVYLLLMGGDKSTQKRDIQRAKAMVLEMGKEQR